MMTEESVDSVEVVASALDACAEGQMTWDEFDISKHDKHYHKHGYNEGDSCKYRDGGEGGKMTEASKEYYAKVMNDVSEKDMFAVLPRDFKIHPVYASSADELYSKHGFNYGTALELQEKGEPESIDVFDDNLEAFYSVVSDFKRRYPNLAFFPAKLIAWKFKDGEAWSTVDDRRRGPTRYIALGNIFKSTTAPSPYHVIRHELGHNLATFDILGKWESTKKKFKSVDAYNSAVQKMSNYAKGDTDEALAEAFAFYTDPFYKKGTLPEAFEDFVEEMIEFSAKNKELVAMDEAKKKREGVEPIDDIYYVICDTFKVYDGPEIRWFDNKKGTIKFYSYEEKFRYALKVYKVPDEWIDRFIEEFPQRKWTDADIHSIQYEYRETTESLEDLIAFYKKWFGKTEKEENK